MAGGKQASGAKREKTLKSTFKAPTVGLEDVIFDYGAGMRPGDFQGYVERIAEHMAGALKRQGPLASKAIKTQNAPSFMEPEDPEFEEDGTGTLKPRTASTKEKIKFKHEYENYLYDLRNWKDCNGTIWNKVISHCTPGMKTKLKSLSGWDQAEINQDGMELVKLLHSVHFEQDGSKQSMLEIVSAKKKLYLCFQRENWDLEYYTREFNARARVCKESGGEEGTVEEVMRLVAEQEGGADYYDNLLRDKASDQTARKEYEALKKKAAEQFLAALHFEGLNSKVYRELKREVHNGWLINGQETMPKSQD